MRRIGDAFVGQYLGSESFGGDACDRHRKVVFWHRWKHSINAKK
jgi:hypothetical protein